MPANKKANNGIAVEMISIDALDLQCIDFIKTDTDGYEEQIIRGAKKTIERFKPFIFLEVKENDCGVILLEEMGYKSIYQTQNKLNILMKHSES